MNFVFNEVMFEFEVKQQIKESGALSNCQLRSEYRQFCENKTVFFSNVISYWNPFSKEQKGAQVQEAPVGFIFIGLADDVSWE